MIKKGMLRVGLLAVILTSMFAFKPSRAIAGMAMEEESDNCHNGYYYIGSYCQSWDRANGCTNYVNYYCSGGYSNCQIGVPPCF